MNNNNFEYISAMHLLIPPAHSRQLKGLVMKYILLADTLI